MSLCEEEKGWERRTVRAAARTTPGPTLQTQVSALGRGATINEHIKTKRIISGLETLYRF